MTKIQASYWSRQMHCGQPNQNFGWAMAHPTHATAPHANNEWWKYWTLFHCNQSCSAWVCRRVAQTGI